jgi:hypothetical protein
VIIAGLTQRRTRFSPRKIHVAFVVVKMASGRVIHRVFRFAQAKFHSTRAPYSVHCHQGYGQRTIIGRRSTQTQSQRRQEQKRKAYIKLHKTVNTAQYGTGITIPCKVTVLNIATLLPHSLLKTCNVRHIFAGWINSIPEVRQQLYPSDSTTVGHRKANPLISTYILLSMPTF